MGGHREITDKKFWTTIKVCVKVMLSPVKILCYRDGIRGGNDEDGSPHRVSDSESESESEQDSEYFFV